jgi:hypothetical protein
VIGPISKFWETKKMSWTTSSGDQGSVVTVSRIVDDDTVGVIAPSPGGTLLRDHATRGEKAVQSNPATALAPRLPKL